MHLTNYDLPQPDPENIKIRDQRIQEKEEKAQANKEMSDEDKLAELAAVLENDEETMVQVKKMLDSYGNDVEFVNLKVRAYHLHYIYRRRSDADKFLLKFK